MLNSIPEKFITTQERCDPVWASPPITERIHEEYSPPPHLINIQGPEDTPWGMVCLLFKTDPYLERLQTLGLCSGFQTVSPEVVLGYWGGYWGSH